MRFFVEGGPPALVAATGPCAHHPGAKAGWHCDVCAADLCADCVVRLEVRQTWSEAVVDCCRECEGPAHAILVPGSRDALGLNVLSLFRRRFSMREWGAAGLLYLMLGWRFTAVGKGYGFAVELLTVPAFWLMFFLVLRSAWAGTGGFGHEEFDPVRHLLRPTLRASLLSGVALVAGTLMVRALTFSDNAFAGPSALSWGVTLISAGLFPALVIGLVIDEPLATALAPAAMLERIRVLGSDYLRIATLCEALGLMLNWWRGAAEVCARNGAVPQGALINGAGVYISLVAACAMGSLLSLRGTWLGYECPQSARVPALPGAIPRGVRKPRVAPAPASPRPASIEVEGWGETREEKPPPRPEGGGTRRRGAT